MNVLLNHINRYTSSAAIVIIALAVLRAMFADGFWLREFWYDEAFSGLLVRIPWQEFLPALTSDVHPPLYYFLLKCWSGLFGTVDVALRSLSVVFFAGFLWYLFLFIKEGTGRSFLALAMLAFFSQNPFFLQYAQEARMYMLLAFLTMAACYFFQRALFHSPQQIDRNWWIFSVLLGLILYTHYVAWVMPVAFLLAAFVECKRNDQLEGFAYLWLRVLLVPLFLMALWLPFFWHQLELIQNIQWTHSIEIQDFVLMLHTFLFGTEQGAHGIPPVNTFIFPLWPLVSGMAIAVSMLFLMRLRKRLTYRENKIFHLCLLIFVVTLEVILLAEILGKHLFLSRYLFFVSPFLLIPLLLLASKLSPPKFPLISLTLYFCLTLLIAPTFWQTHFRELTSEIETTTHQNVVFNNPFEYFIALFYKTGDRDYLFYSAGHSPEKLQGWVLFRGREIVASPQEIPLDSLLIAGSDLWQIEDWNSFNEVHGYELLEYRGEDFQSKPQGSK